MNEFKSHNTELKTLLSIFDSALVFTGILLITWVLFTTDVLVITEVLTCDKTGC
jgi:hypothetical protein